MNKVNFSCRYYKNYPFLASEFSSKLNELHATKNHIRESLDTNRATLNEFSDEFKKMIDGIRSEIESVQKHVNK